MQAFFELSFKFRRPVISNPIRASHLLGLSAAFVTLKEK
jgi:hypothetical protein